MEDFASTLVEKIQKVLGAEAEDGEAVVFGCASGSGFVSSDYSATSPITGFRLDAGKLVMEVALRRFLNGNLCQLEYDEPHNQWQVVVDYPGVKTERYPVHLTVT